MLLMAACDSDVFFSESHRIDDNGWHMNDKQVFNITAEDTTETYLFYLDIRNRADYPFSNIFFSITTIYPNGEVAQDTNIEFQLAQPDGQWLGRESGHLVDGRYPFCLFRFPEPGNYQFVIGQAMRDTLLPGIHDIGIHIEKSER